MGLAGEPFEAAIERWTGVPVPINPFATRECGAACNF